MTNLKQCTKCGQEKPYSDFYKTSHNKKGLAPSCKECMKKASSDNRVLYDDSGAVWTTESEKRFIMDMSVDPKILKKYVAALPLRVDWVDIDDREIRNFAMNVLSTKEDAL